MEIPNATDQGPEENSENVEKKSTEDNLENELRMVTEGTTSTTEANTISVEKKPNPVVSSTVSKKRKIGSDFNSESDNGPKRKVGGNRLTKKRRLEEGAPRPPLTGYVRYMNERREKLKPDYPDKSHIEMTKIIADEWSRLNEQEKLPYLKVAEAERAVYNNAMIEFYKQKRLNGQENKNPIGSNGNTKIISNGGSKYSQMNGNSSDVSNNNSNSTKSSVKLSSVDNKNNENRLQSYYPDGCIPIFTDEFLDHNKTIDLELRALRKSNIDYEQQNSVLEKHIENMKTGVEKIENENKELAEKNRLMQKYLDKLRAKLAQAFSGLPLPGEPNGATLDNIDKYMTDLQGMVSSNSHGVNKARDIVRKLDLHISL
ncbi:high mobility group protein 20A [Condylostylus longicornis]|uniref:high mobility group protein 20A n=1 Tax=Condylostylus longicornis TaxID=2530218 RepID=UPI00244E1801|nr:high mobility group protein 20A [Condylostylus longicornis]